MPTSPSQQTRPSESSSGHLSETRGTLFIVSGPSGSGKTSLCQIVLGAMKNLRFSVSYTTRAPRRNEVDGVDYFFIGEDEFRCKRSAGQFLESAQVYGNFYATGRQFVVDTLANGVDVLLDIDIQGARQVKKQMPDAISALVFPPSRQLLRERLERRALDRTEVIRERLDIALGELNDYRSFDFLIVNENLDAAAGELKAIVTACRCRAERQAPVVSRIISTFEQEL